MDLEKYRVFKVTGGTARKIIDDYFDALKDYRDYLNSELGSYGQIRVRSNNVFAGIAASSNPDKSLFRYNRRDGLFVLRKRSEKAAVLAEKIERFYTEVNTIIVEGKFARRMKMMLERTPAGGLFIPSSTFWGDPANGYFVGIPKSAGDVVPVDGLEEIKLSEYYRILEAADGNAVEAG